MMKNYDRYLETSSEDYDKKTIMSYFCRVPSDRKIFPLLSELADKKILDVGLGTGYYSRLLIGRNSVVGIDQNPHLCRLAIEVHEGDATKLSELVKDEKFDIVVSTWMTEYLDDKQLGSFFSESKKVLVDGGKLITTVISKYGFGFLYVTAAKLLRGIDKYNYRKEQVIGRLKEAGFTKIEIVSLNSWLGVPWAYMVIAR
jgi:SAM-dependent methyltransferase